MLLALSVAADPGDCLPTPKRSGHWSFPASLWVLAIQFRGLGALSRSFSLPGPAPWENTSLAHISLISSTLPGLDPPCPDLTAHVNPGYANAHGVSEPANRSPINSLVSPVSSVLWSFLSPF